MVILEELPLLVQKLPGGCLLSERLLVASSRTITELSIRSEFINQYSVLIFILVSVSKEVALGFVRAEVSRPMSAHIVLECMQSLRFCTSLIVTIF